MSAGTIRVGIIDDERLARERLAELLACEPDMQLAFSSADGESGLDAALQGGADLLFVDVQMPGMNGLALSRELLERLGAEALPLIVFVTAHEEHALEAFQTHALDYLVKPFDDDRFAALLDRVRIRVRQRRLDSAAGRLRSVLDGEVQQSSASAEPDTGRLERFAVRSGTRVRLLRAELVDRIEAEGVYARLHVGDLSFLIRVPMHELEARLDPRRFARIHRSTIVNLDRVAEFREEGRGEFTVLLADGSRHRLSRSRKSHVEKLLGQQL